MAGKNCSICGKPSGIYPLCKHHLELKAQGIVIKNDEGKWIEKILDKDFDALENDPIVIGTNIKKDNPEQKCIICDTYAPNGLLCKNCYHEMLEYQDQFDKNSKLYELTDYYYNLKDNIFRMQNFEKVKENCKKLFALADLTNTLYDNTTLLSKIKDDITKIISTKTKITNTKKEEQDNKNENKSYKKDSQREELLRTIDGHKVKSRGEKIIDDILFTNRIPHAYSMTVAEIDTKIDRSIECDWFIPIIGSGKGIYIEYWGMDKQDYNDNKKEKTELYKKYDLPLIQIEKDEIDDSQALNIRIRREINSLAKEKYRTIVDF